MTKTDIVVRAVEPEDWPDIAEMFEQPRVIAGTLQLPFRSRAFQRKRAEDNDPSRLRLGAVVGLDFALTHDIERMLGDPGLEPKSVADPVPRLEALAVRFESDHPALAQVLRQLVDALGKAGI